MKRRRWMVGAAIAIAAGTYVVWKLIGNMTVPTPPTDWDSVADRINQANERANVAEVLDIVPLDDRHLFVPFISEDGEYGASFWVWKRFEWDIPAVQSHGYPQNWQLKENDPASGYLVWNLDPASKIKELDFYLIRDREAGRTDGNDYYRPRAQLETSVGLDGRSYGILRMPDDWIELQEAAALTEDRRRLHDIWGWTESGVPQYRIGYVSVLDGEPEALGGSSWSYGSGTIHLSPVFILNDRELERPVQGFGIAYR